MSIRIRIDDVLCRSSAFSNERAENRFFGHYRWTEDVKEIVCVPTVLVKEIQEFPRTIEFLKEKTKERRMFPEIHGYEHIDYDKLTQEEIEKHLKLCLEWFNDILNWQPTIWATPWGGVNPIMQMVASKFNLTIETTQNTISPKAALNVLRLSRFPNATILVHWWEKGSRVLQICDILRFGYTQAIEEDKKRNPSIFPENKL